MRRFLITLTAIAAMGSALAQSPPPRPDPAKFLERLTIVLDLDEYQKGEVQKVLEAQRAKMEAAREQLRASGERPSFEQMKAQHDAAQKETVEALSSVLTPEQLKKFEAFMADRGPMMRGPRDPAAEKK